MWPERQASWGRALAAWGLVAACVMLGACAAGKFGMSDRCTPQNRAQLDGAIELAAEGEYAQAQTILVPLSEACGVRAPEAAQTMFWLAYCQEKLGQYPAAWRSYHGAIARDPLSELASRAHERLMLISPSTQPATRPATQPATRPVTQSAMQQAPRPVTQSAMQKS